MADVALARTPLPLRQLDGANTAAVGEVPTADGLGGVAWAAPTGGGGGGSITTAQAVGRSTGDYSVPGTLSALDSTNLTATVPAVTGDVLEFTFVCCHYGGGELTTSVYSVNRAAHTHGTGGIGWQLTSNAGLVHHSWSVLYTVQSADVSGGNATFHLYAAGGSVTIKADTTRPLPLFGVKNLGQ